MVSQMLVNLNKKVKNQGHLQIQLIVNSTMPNC